MIEPIRDQYANYRTQCVRLDQATRAPKDTDDMLRNLPTIKRIDWKQIDQGPPDIDRDHEVDGSKDVWVSRFADLQRKVIRQPRKISRGNSEKDGSTTNDCRQQQLNPRTGSRNDDLVKVR